MAMCVGVHFVRRRLVFGVGRVRTYATAMFISLPGVYGGATPCAAAEAGRSFKSSRQQFLIGIR
ncbi:hypothetical protein QTP88_009212 [Uroleucon formosanum]